jgi:hypothetical protein
MAASISDSSCDMQGRLLYITGTYGRPHWDVWHLAPLSQMDLNNKHRVVFVPRKAFLAFSMRSSICSSYVFDFLPFPKKYISDIVQQFVHLYSYSPLQYHFERIEVPLNRYVNGEYEYKCTNCCTMSDIYIVQQFVHLYSYSPLTYLLRGTSILSKWYCRFL